jgi:hypothetical protein
MRVLASGRWLLATVLAIGTAWFSRGKVDAWTRDRLACERRHQIASLPERGAAEYVTRLGADDDRSLATIVEALGDQRSAVAASAEAALWRLIDGWSQQPTEDNSTRVALLASLLSKRCANLPAERRDFSIALAQRLIAWPVDGDKVDMARLIADCEVVLRLPMAAPSELRVARAPRVVAPLAPAQRDETPPEPQRFKAPVGVRIGDE